MAAAACAYDFHAFDPIGDDGAHDASLDRGAEDAGPGPGPRLDGSADSNLPTCATPANKCLSTAIECGRAAIMKGDDCRGKCGILAPPECKGACNTTEENDKRDCRSTCNRCTADAGCEDPLRCRDAVDGRDS
ncbi:hypothetical protein [Pendulispora albinea]|uniref:Uncharacterized protein n=1 Tax=Pendulispora albinea TaxID=2741071 RepID=A0ABZ2LQ59_9BACT